MPGRTGPDPLAASAFALAVDVRAAEVIDALERAGIASILLKGATLARWLYPRETRRYSDVDVLVEADALAEGGRVLAQFGYWASPYDDASSHAQAYHRTGDAIDKIDVHRSFHYVGVASTAFWERIERDAVPFALPGHQARAPSLAARALLIALHAIVHGPSAGQQRDDLRRALAGGEELWASAVELARELDAVAGLAVGLRCLPAGALLADRLGLPSELPRRLVLAAQGAPATAAGIVALVEADSPRARLRLLGRELFPPRLQMHKHVPLARRGRVGMLAAYALRPAALARRLPAGWRAVRSLQASRERSVASTPSASASRRRRSE
jgi:hypothetical protein